MKKDMFIRVDQLVSEFRKVSDKQMAETTKRTIRENVSITAQMSKMSNKTVELIEENDELKMKEKKMINKLKILEHNEKELTKKNLSGQKVWTRVRIFFSALNWITFMFDKVILFNNITTFDGHLIPNLPSRLGL